MITQNPIASVEVNSLSEPKFCKVCVQGKASCLLFLKESQTIFAKYGEKVVTDLWSSAQVQSLRGHSYYYLHHDMYTAEECVTFLKKKSEVFKLYQKNEA